jgi:hypothetical protein
MPANVRNDAFLFLEQTYALRTRNARNRRDLTIKTFLSQRKQQSPGEAMIVTF